MFLSANVSQAEKHWLLLTVIITTAVLSLIAGLYYLSKLVSCSPFRRLRLFARKRRTGSDIERLIVDKDWLERDVPEKGASSPHLE